MEDYYANGMLKYKSITIIIGAKKNDFGSFYKTKTHTMKYYENGQLELEQTISEKPAKAKRNETTGQPMNKIPKIVRNYKNYNHAGIITEKGWEKTRKSKNVSYNVGLHKKIITKTNQKWRNPKVKYIGTIQPIKSLNIEYIKPNP